jgi:hypothetical protein
LAVHLGHDVNPSPDAIFAVSSAITVHDPSMWREYPSSSIEQLHLMQNSIAHWGL